MVSVKFLLSAFLISVTGSTVVLAQKIESAPPEIREAPSSPKKLTDSLPVKPTPTPETAPRKVDKRTPEQVVTEFFTALQADQVDAAYESLSAGSMLATKGQESSDIRSRTQQALDAYGPFSGFELIKTEHVGAHLERRTYLFLGEVLPLRWRFYFYKGSGEWKLVDLRVDDALVELFDEVGTSAKP
jgi:hypothetical protein